MEEIILEQMNKKDLAIKQLVDKSIEIGRTPLKSDFSSEDACFIKQKLGPWPRALEEAGLKESVKSHPNKTK